LALGSRTARRLLARARAAAVLPSVQGEYHQSIDRDFQLDQEAGTADALKQDLGAGRGAKVRATWDLGRLIFNPDELRAARAALDAAAERERCWSRSPSFTSSGNSSCSRSPCSRPATGVRPSLGGCGSPRSRRCWSVSPACASDKLRARERSSACQRSLRL